MRIVFTGGGTAGHVTPNLALIDALRENWDIAYIGSKDGIEREMLTAYKIPYYAIRCGKLRRYFSLKNFWDPVNILLGMIQALIILLRIKPNIIFSKGGFVAFPVVFAGWLLRIPVIAHESDFTPGLANRLSFPFVQQICVTFAAAKNGFKDQSKVQITGTPIREQLLQGVRERGQDMCGFSGNKPCLLVMGGGQGSIIINQCIRSSLKEILEQYQIIHLCGQGQLDSTLNLSGYYQLAYAHEELGDLLAAADIVVSRAGANSIYELLALEKPHILIPLSRKASRGDQIENANYFAQLGLSTIIQEIDLTPITLLAAIKSVDCLAIKDKIRALNITSATKRIVNLLKDF